MVKKSRSIYIIGSIIIGLASLFLVYFLLMMTGVIMVKNENLIITSGSVEATYNGEEIKCETIKIIDGELAKGHSIEAVFTGSLVNVGVTTNTYYYKIVDSEGVEVTDNYVVKKLEGTITVNKRTINIRATDATKPYDGTPLTSVSAGYQLVSGELVQGHTLEVSPYGEITNVGMTNNELHYTITDSEGNIVTGNYDVVVTPGVLAVTQISIVITSLDASKAYDGTPLEKDECKITMGELVDYTGDGIPDHKLVTKTTGTITNPGVEKNTFEYEIIDIHTGDVVTSNYQIEPVYGTLTVVSNDLVFMGRSFEMEYNGLACPKEKFVVEPTAESKKVLEENNYTYEVTIDELLETDAGTYKILYDVVIYDKDGTDITEFCELETIYGELEILKKKIIVETASDKIIYTGKPYYTETSEFNKVVISGSVVQLAETQEIIKLSKYNLEIIDANSYENIVEVQIFKADGVTETTTNYDIKYDTGNIIIQKKELVINTPDIKVTYDGKFPFIDVTKYVPVGLLDGHNITYEAKEYTISDYIAADNLGGKLLNKPETVSITDNETGEDVTKNYGILDQGYRGITILQAPLTITSKSQSKYYDREELVYEYIDLTFNENVISQNSTDNNGLVEINFFNGHIAKIEFEERAPLINVGTIKNKYDYAIYNLEGLDVTSLFNVVEIVGELTIEKVQIKVITGSKSNYYNGLELFDKTYNLSITHITDLSVNSIEGTDNKTITNTGIEVDVVLTNYPKITDVGEISNNLSFAVYDAGTENVNSNFEILITSAGKLSVTPYYVVLETYRMEKEYQNGKLYSGIEEGIKISEATSSKNMLNGTYLSSIEHFKESNYGLFNGQSLYISEEWTSISIGYIINKPLSYMFYDANGDPVSYSIYSEGVEPTSNYVVVEKFNYISITNPDFDYTISPTPIVVKDKVFGSSMDHDYAMSLGIITSKYMVDGDLNGMTLEVEIEILDDSGNVVSSATEAGSYVTRISSYTLIDKDGKDVTKEYRIKTQTSYIKLYKYKATITSPSITVEYTGEEVFGEKNFSISGLQSGHYVKLDDNSNPKSITQIGSVFNSYKYKIYDENDNDVSEYYSVTESWGKITITPITINLYIGDIDFIVSEDTQYITNEDFVSNDYYYSIDEDVLLEGHELISFKSESLSGISVGTSGVVEITSFVISDGTNDVTKYYNIIVNGSIIVVKN